MNITVKCLALPLLLALSACATLSGANSRQAEHWVAMAASAVDEGDSSGALQALAKAEALNGKDPNLFHVRAQAYLLRKDLPAALQAARVAHELASEDGSISTTLGKILIENHQEAQAEVVLLPAANDPLFSESFRARTNLAIIYMNRGKNELALEQLDRAINEAPLQACHAYFFRSQIRLKTGRLSDSIVDLDHATHGLCGAFAEAHLGLGIALAKNKQYDLARKKFIEVRQRFSGTNFAKKAVEHLGYLP